MTHIARGSMVQVQCERCGQPFSARTADRERGWGRFCSKTCSKRNAEAQPKEAPMSESHPDALDPMQAIEPAAAAMIIHPETGWPRLNIDETLALSTAISLKRIADSLTALGVDRVGLAGWIEHVAYYSGQSFERGRSDCR